MYSLSYKMIYQDNSEWFNEEVYETYEECLEAKHEMIDSITGIEFTSFRINYTEEETYY